MSSAPSVLLLPSRCRPTGLATPAVRPSPSQPERAREDQAQEAGSGRQLQGARRCCEDTVVRQRGHKLYGGEVGARGDTNLINDIGASSLGISAPESVPRRSGV